MLKIKLNELWNKYKNRISKIGIIILMAIVILFALRMFFASFEDPNNTNNVKSTYNPESTVISGSDVNSTKQDENFNIINIFITYCNNKDVQSAYNMLTEGCKKNMYPTINDFYNLFLEDVFATKREYNIQSWINNSKYTTYRLRIIDNILETGDYNSSVKYETYITTYSKEDKEKISVGEYLYTESINKTTNTDLIEATVVKKNIYVQEEEYEIKIKNLSNKTILLDDLEDATSIRLYGEDGNPYSPYYDRLSNTNLKVDSGETITIKIKFNKSAGSENISNQITFKKIIKDYESYVMSKEKYNEERVSLDIKF